MTTWHYILHPEEFDVTVTQMVLKRALMISALVLLFDFLTTTPNILLHGITADENTSWGQFLFSPSFSTLITTATINSVWLIFFIPQIVLYFFLEYKISRLLGSTWALFICLWSGAELGWGEGGNILAALNAMSNQTTISLGIVGVCGGMILYHYIFYPVDHQIGLSVDEVL